MLIIIVNTTEIYLFVVFQMVAVCTVRNPFDERLANFEALAR